jgi:AcrR family transcriptional regulator
MRETPSPRELRRQQRVATSREQILDTAEELFGNQGYRATSLQQVAERCEFSVGALYQFFASKEELLQATMNRRGPELLQAMHEGIDPGATGDINLLNLLDAITVYFRLYPEFGRLSIRLYSPGEDAPKDLGPAGEGFHLAMTLFAEVFRAGQEEGRLRGGAPPALARLAAAMITGYHRADPAITPGAAGLSDQEFREILARAFAPPP